MADAHASPNYWMIWLYLFVLTVIEIAVIYMPLAKALVAMYFMHLRFERLTLGIIALTPFILCVFLILMLFPDLA